MLDFYNVYVIWKNILSELATRKTFNMYVILTIENMNGGNVIIKNHLAVMYVRDSLSIQYWKFLHSFHPNRSWEHGILHHWKVPITSCFWYDLYL